MKNWRVLGRIGRIPIRVAVLALLMLEPLSAQMISVDFFSNISYRQTSVFPPTTPVGYFFDLGIRFANPGDFTNGSVTYPGPASPQALSLSSPTSLFFPSPVI